MKRIMFVSSKGGHFNELMKLEPLFKNYKVTIVTESSNNKNNLKKVYKMYNIHFLLKHSKYKMINFFKLIADCFISLYYFIRFRPQYIVTTGAFAAGPISCIAKIFGKKIVYIETMANINSPTKTGKIIYKFADLFIVQWEEMLKVYPNAVYGGWIV